MPSTLLYPALQILIYRLFPNFAPKSAVYQIQNQADVIQCAPVVNETAGWGINCDLGCILIIDNQK